MGELSVVIHAAAAACDHQVPYTPAPSIEPAAIAETMLAAGMPHKLPAV